MTHQILKKVKDLVVGDHVLYFGDVKGVSPVRMFNGVRYMAFSFDSHEPYIWAAEDTVYVRGDGTLQGKGYSDRLQLRVERSTEAADLVWLGIKRNGNLEQGIHVNLEELRVLLDSDELPEPK